MQFKAITLCLIQAMLNIAGVALVRAGVDNLIYSTPMKFLIDLANLKLAAGMFLIATGFVFTIFILMSFKLSFYQPLSSGITFIVTLCVSYFFLKEPINLTSIIGIIVIMIGCLIISSQNA